MFAQNQPGFHQGIFRHHRAVRPNLQYQPVVVCPLPHAHVLRPEAHAENGLSLGLEIGEDGQIMRSCLTPPVRPPQSIQTLFPPPPAQTFL